ncbi:flagellin [Massilia sp. UBA6681]|uniref:flagellin N-terminal helical domain-containing protein n=1 Tax=Massilia sp. UBA6681 TaxID=1946839 RepID=UPI0025BBAB83|nr:flagellin [Massilia sp. UBA6681]
MLSLHTNNAALSAQNSLSRTQSTLSTSMTRLSTGFRINSAMDDAAGLQIATRLKAQTSGMAVAMRNTQNSISMLQTAEGALDEVSNILVRMKDLATQAADGSSSAADKGAMQSEYDSLASELSNIIGNTTFGGAKLLTKNAVAADKLAADGVALAANDTSGPDTDFTDAQNDLTTAKTDYGSGTITKAALDAAQATYDAALKVKTLAHNKKAVTAAYATAVTNSIGKTDGALSGSIDFQIGASAGEKMSLALTTDVTALHTKLRDVSVNYNAFGAAISGTGTELTDTASIMIDKLQAAVEAVSTVRSGMGAAANRLEHVHNNLSNISTNTKNATGRIMDVDFATESAKMTSSQMLMQAGTAMLKQSNSMSSMVMSLLQ